MVQVPEECGRLRNTGGLTGVLAFLQLVNRLRRVTAHCTETCDTPGPTYTFRPIRTGRSESVAPHTGVSEDRTVPSWITSDRFVRCQLVG